MNRSVLIYGGLLVVLLGLAWTDWTREPELDVGDKIIVAQGSVDEIERIVFKSEKDDVVMERRTDDRGAYYWVTDTRWEKAAGPTAPAAGPDAATPDAATPDAATPDAATPDAATPEPTPSSADPHAGKVAKLQEFKAGDAADKLAESFSPLLALRKLDGVTGDKLVTIGLDAPKEFLELTRKGRTRKFELGGEAYGSKDRYVRDVESGEIFLFDDEILRPLKYATTRLPDRDLFSFERKDIVTATITAGASSLELTQKNPDDEKSATWVPAASPETAASPQALTWMGKALQLKGTAYARPDELPANLESRFRVTFKDTKGVTETMEILQDGADGDWYGRSEHTRGLIKLLRGPTSGLAEDVGDLVSGG